MRLLNPEALKANLERTAMEGIGSGKTGGVSMLVAQRGKTVYEGCFSDEKLGILVDAETQFRMASMTKPITAAAVLILLDRGLLRLDDPVSMYLPGFTQMKIGRVADGKLEIVGNAATPITILHLLTHSSGLGSGETEGFLAAHRPRESMANLEAAVRYYETTPLDFEPFTKACYSPVFAFDVLARIVELISGESFDLFLKREVLEPLGMDHTTFTPEIDQWKQMIPMHTYENGQEKRAEFPEHSIFSDYPTTYFCGGAGLTSTLHDYARFAEMLLGEGNFRGRQILRPETVKLMRTPQLPAGVQTGDDIWGLGVRVITPESGSCLPLGCFGWSGAYGTHFWVDPENEITAVYLKNSLYDGGSGASTARQFEKDVCAALVSSL